MAVFPSLMALRCFDASARQLSFTRAAQDVCLTQGAVSHQMLSLEALLGVELFTRKRGGLELTAAGRSYWAEVAIALRQIERATQNLLTHQGEGGVLNLCVASSFATYWLIPRLSGFVARHPEVTLNLSTHIGPVDFSSTLHDAAIEFCDGPVEGLIAEKVLPLVLQPYGQPAPPKTNKRASGKSSVREPDLLKILGDAPLIRHTTVPNAWPAWLESASLLDRIPERHYSGGPQYDLLSMALNGVIAGLGTALLPRYVVEGALANGQIRQLSDRTWTPARAYYLRYPAWKGGSVALRKLQDWLKTQ